MDYPDDFNTPAFPAGPSIAISRFMAIASSVLFVVIIFVCIILLWAMRSQRIDPFIVSVNEFTGQWVVMHHSHGNNPFQFEYTAIKSMQESVVGNFTANWFTISENVADNDAMWQTCNRTQECGNESNLKYGDKTCALFCASGEDLFSRFIYNVVPDYQKRVAAGERWIVDKTQIQIEPAAEITESGGTWNIFVTVQSNINGEMQVLGFVKVARNTELYPQTLGYYVADFNTYRIN